jgi:type III pantothenate kinase
MNLVLDFGNTRIKAGVFYGNDLVENHIFDNSEEILNSSLLLHEIKNCIVASVTGDHEEIYPALSDKFHTMLFKADTPIPLKNLYKTALTLGSDRIAAAVGAFSLFPSANVLTIDAGTCIKYNFVNAGNEYLGGAISPGIPMRFKAMHEFTQRLPLVKPDPMFEKLTGTTTADSISAGAITGAVCEADGMIERYQAQYKDLKLVITGGDAPYLCRQLKKRFFASENLLLLGLNTILKFNLEK